MITIAIINSKGGVGKTTTAANVGACMALMGKKVLLVDLDQQRNLSQSFNIPPQNTIYDLLKDTDGVSPTEILPSLHLLPSEKKLAEFEVELVGKMARESILKKRLQAFESVYDFIIIDCSPSVGLLTINALTACDKVLIPLQAQYLAMEGVKALTDTLVDVKNNLNSELEILGVILTMFNRRKILNREVAIEIEKHYPIFETYIRENIALAEAPAAGTDVFRYAPESNGAKDYQALTNEIMYELGGHRLNQPAP